MVNFKQEMVEQLIKDVNKFEGELVSKQILEVELENERNTKIQEIINTMGMKLQQAMIKQSEETTNYFQQKIDKQ